MSTQYARKAPGREVTSYPAEYKAKIGATFADLVRFNVAEEGLIRAARQLGIGYNEAGEALLEWAGSEIAKARWEGRLEGARAQLLRPRVVEIRRAGPGLPPPTAGMRRAA